jgi:hypothetical protein
MPSVYSDRYHVGSDVEFSVIVKQQISYIILHYELLFDIEL